jgi:hypothetical protein
MDRQDGNAAPRRIDLTRPAQHERLERTLAEMQTAWRAMAIEIERAQAIIDRIGDPPREHRI